MATPATPPNPGTHSVVPIQRTYKGCSNIKEYRIMDKLGEGTFGEVHKAQARKTNDLVALKKILMHNEKDGFPITALREIKLLKLLSHENVLKLVEMAVERPKAEGRKKAVLYMVTPYMEHDLSGLLDNPDVQFTEPQIKCYMLQLLKGLQYLHNENILHRDMKAANLLISNKGILQIGDFGLARHYEGEVPRAGRGGGEATREYTALVVTRWYRPPELLLSLRRYTTAIDMWGAGCVFGEMFKRKPILSGNSDLNQAQLIFDLVGSPTEASMPGWSALSGCESVKQWPERKGNINQVFREQGSSAIDLLKQLLKLDWRKRINAIDALNHPYFKMDPQPARPQDLPKFQDSHELDRRGARGPKNALPPAPTGGTVGMGPNGEHQYGAPGNVPPPPGLPNGQWPNGDRHPRHDRGPPGPPAQVRHRGGYERNHDHRGGGGPRQQYQDNTRPMDPDRGPRQPLPAPPGEGRHPLPNPPPPYRGPDRDRGERGPQSNSKAIDTYIPSYHRDHHEAPPRDVRRGSHESRDALPPHVDRGPRRDEFWDRGPRRTRSRSPERRDRDRRDRERDVYSRR